VETAEPDTTVSAFAIPRAMNAILLRTRTVPHQTMGQDGPGVKSCIATFEIGSTHLVRAEPESSGSLHSR